MPDFVRTQVRSICIFPMLSLFSCFLLNLIGVLVSLKLHDYIIEICVYLVLPLKIPHFGPNCVLAASEPEAIGLMFTCPPAMGPLGFSVYSLGPKKFMSWAK